MLFVLAAAFGIGLVFNAAPGPVFAATLRHGVRGGFRPALAVQVGSLAGDAVWAVLGLAGVGMLGELESLRLPIGLAGVVYLCWLAWDSWQTSKQEFAVMDEADRSQTAFRSGVLLSLTNPQNIGYWAALGSALGALGVRDPTFGDYSVFFAGFMLSSVVWAFLFAALVHWALGRNDPRWARITYRMCAVLFLALAMASLRDLWTSPEHALSAPAVERRD
jgi:chemosensory pili system protein ChpE